MIMMLVYRISPILLSNTFNALRHSHTLSMISLRQTQHLPPIRFDTLHRQNRLTLPDLSLLLPMTLFGGGGGGLSGPPFLLTNPSLKELQTWWGIRAVFKDLQNVGTNKAAFAWKP